MSKWTDEEIIEGNNIILKFMGYEYVPWNNKDGYKAGWWKVETPELIKKSTMPTKLDHKVYIGRHLNRGYYFDSFNNLMPILEKLSNIGCIVQCSYALNYTCHIWNSLGKNTGSINIIEGSRGGDSPELATFKAIVKFLKEYNESKKPN